MEHSLTVEVQHWIERLKQGELSAREKLLQCACDRLLRLTRKLLREFPAVRRWEETDDVFQNASLRLYRSLESVELTDARHFFRLAALQIRRELIDLSRHYQGPQGHGAHHATLPRDVNASDQAAPVDDEEATRDPRRVAEWTDFHRSIEELPAEEREVFDLLWYHGLTSEEAASLLGVDARTVRRRWRAARVHMYEKLQGELPGM
ncbi:MAG: sigma-70 family RNA polymerase sigma factor [Gemmataceae bacterium]